jgi:hypothetical protein
MEGGRQLFNSFPYPHTGQEWAVVLALVARALTSPTGQEHWDLALRPLRLLVKTDTGRGRSFSPMLSWARTMMIQALLNTMRFEETITVAEELLERRGLMDIEIMSVATAQICSLRELGRPEEALAAVRRIKTMNPGLPADTDEVSEAREGVGASITVHSKSCKCCW